MARAKQWTANGREQFWREQIRAQRAGGQRVRKSCHAAGLGVPSFDGWRREVRIRDTHRAASHRPRIMPIRMMPRPPPVSVIEVALAGRRPSANEVSQRNAEG